MRTNILNFSSKSEFRLLLFIALTVIAVFMALSCAAFPEADDYCYAVKANKLGFIAAQLDWYSTWSGRYSATALISGIPLAGDITHTYSWVLAAAQLAMIGSLFLFLRSLLQRRLPVRYVLLGAMVAYVIFITGLPDVGQYVYWTMGIADYALGNVTLLLLLSIAVEHELGTKKNGIQSVLRFAVAAIMMIIAVGTNEITLLCLLILFSSACVLAIRRQTESVWFWTGLCLVAVMASLVSVFAPGDFVRSQSLAVDGTLRPSALLALGLFLPWFLLRAAYWLANPVIWASAFIIFMVSRESAVKILYRNKVFQRVWLYLPVFWVALLLTLTSVGFVVNHYPLPERAESIVWLVFLLGWYPSFIIIFHYITGDDVAKFSDFSRRAAVVVLGVSMLGSQTVVEAFKDSYRGVRYWREMNARMDLIKTAKNNAIVDIEVPSLSRPPRTLYTTEITTDPDNFRDSCMAEYYGLRSMALGRHH